MLKFSFYVIFELILNINGIDKRKSSSIYGTTYSGSKESLIESKREIENHVKQLDSKEIVTRQYYR
ncbi:hypothetical protein GCM10022258_04840 [Aquimarina gracilis]